MSVGKVIESRAACVHCDSQMVRVSIKKYPGNWPYALIGLGVLFTFFIVGGVVGIPMVIIGIYMLLNKEKITICPECGYYFKVYATRNEE